MIKEGLEKAGDWIGEGLDKGGDLIKGLFGKAEEKTEVNDSTLNRLRSVSQTTGRVREFTVTQVAT